MKKIKLGNLNRSYNINNSSIDVEKRTVELAFSSETPYEREFGIEILDHNVTSINLERLQDGGPLLVDHDPEDHIGTIESVTIGLDKIARAVVRFGRSQRAQEIFQDVIDNIRHHISVGYVVNKLSYEGKDERNVDIYRVTDWMPLEISFVSIPADAKVGVGRNAVVNEKELEIEDYVEPTEIIEEHPADCNCEECLNKKGCKPKENKEEDNIKSIDNKLQNNNNITNNIIITENKNMDQVKLVNDILNLGAKFEKFGGKELAEQFIRSGNTDLNALQMAIFEKMESAGALKTAKDTDNNIGLSQKEISEYSILNAVRAYANNKSCKELEMSKEVARKLGKDARGFYVPAEVLKRDLNVATPGDGGYTVDTTLDTGNFIDQLTNKMVATKLGVRVITGLTGNVAIPKKVSGASTYWVSENGTATETSAVFTQVPLTMKTVASETHVSRNLLMQSSMNVESFIMDDLKLQMALAMDNAIFNGTGLNNQPTGILNTSGIGAVAIGTNGGALTWDHIVDLETAVAVANADLGSLAYVSNAKVRGSMKKTPKVSGFPTYLYDGKDLNGYNFEATNQIPSNLTKGTGTNLSAMLYGNFSDVVVGFWGVLDIMVDQYTLGGGAVKMVAFQSADVAIRNPESFAAIKDIVV